MLANRQTRQNGGVGANGSALTNDGPAERIGILLAAREWIIGEGGIRSNKDIIFQGNSIPELYTALDGDPVSHDDIVFYERVIADIAIFADDGARQYVRERPYARCRANSG